MKEILAKIEKDLNLIGLKRSNWNREYFNNHKDRYKPEINILKQLGYPVIGVDINPKRVQKFIKKHKLEVIKCDVEQERLPFKHKRCYPFN